MAGKKRDWAKYDKNKYNPKWEQEAVLKDWLQPASDEVINQGKGAAYCKLCQKPIRAQHSDLLDHLKTKNHKRRAAALPSTTQPVLQNFGYECISGRNVKEKTIDIKLSVLTACHSSIRSVNHLTDMVRTTGGQNSDFKDIRLHRTKCSKIIERVVAPCLLEEMIADIGDHFYSLIIDESTDVTTIRQLALCVKYYSRKYKKFLVEFLGLIETPVATADKLYEVVTLYLTTIGLKLNRLLGLGTDGGANLCGCNHSLYTLLKKNHCPWLMLVKCTCHSLDKAASYASKELPETLEFLLRESKNHFKNSHNRRDQYERLYEEMNGYKPPLLVRVAATRWLSYHGAVKTHLSQYNALQAYFNAAVARERPDRVCPTLKRVSDLHDDARSILLLTFLRPILEKITIANVLFQKTNADLTKAFSDLRVFVFSMARRVLKENALVEPVQPGVLRRSECEALRAALQDREKLRPLDRVDYGEAFKNLAKSLSDAGQITAEKLNEVRAYCANYLIRLSKELAQRLPDSIHDIENIRFFTPNRVFATRGRPSFDQLPLHLIPHGYDLDKLKDQWMELGEVRFVDIYPHGDHTIETIPTDVFWGHVLELTNGQGDRPYKEIALCVLTLMTLPLSNAFVERVFSVMAIVKSKLRNKISTSMLSAILFLRLHLQAHGKCCTSLEVTEAMLRRFNSRTMYVYAQRRNRRAGAAANAGDRAAEEDADEPDEPGAAEGIPGAGDGAPAPAVQFENDDGAIAAVLDFLEGDEDINSLFDNIH